MAADTVKSASITTLDGTASSPPAATQLTAGVGGVATVRNYSDFVTMTSGGLASTASTYKMVRLRSDAIVKMARLFVKGGMDSSTGLAVDLGAYYSDAINDGTASANQGVLISANCFVAAQAFGQSGAGSNIDALSNLDANLRNSNLWAQVGLTSDPGGYIDVVLAVHTVVSGTATAGNVYLDLQAIT